MNKKFSTQRHDLCRCVLFHVFLLVTSTLFVPAAFALDGSWRGELRIGSGRLPRSRPWRHARHAGRRPAQPRDRARSHSRGRSPRNGRPQPSFPARRDRRHRRIRHNLRNARARSARARLRLCSPAALTGRNRLSVRANAPLRRPRFSQVGVCQNLQGVSSNLV